MANFGVRNVAVMEGQDHDGDAVLFVDVEHDLSRNPINPSHLSALLSELRGELLKHREVRFPIVRHHFAEDQKVLGYT
jgi:hypothetical protein